MTKKQNEPKTKKGSRVLKFNDPDYLWSMSLAPKVEEATHWLYMLPAAFFTAVVIMIAHLHNYQRPMSQFFWSSNTGELSEFFSYFKMVAICICAALALVMLLYRIATQTMYVKRSFAYIPMIIYIVLVLLSFAFSDYKEFAWYGWNERFEGTLTLLSYMILLFFIINIVNTERNVKCIIYPLAVTSTLLSLLGVSQALGKDFFKTAFGQKLLVPNTLTESGEHTWAVIDALKEQGQNFLDFTFKNQIYQTVYNINYVSFYLTLLIPLFGMLFIHAVMKGKECALWKKILWGILFALLVYNIIGSSSSGGLMGMAVVVLIAAIVLNKRLLQWWKPILLLVAITLIVGGITYQRWFPELAGAIDGVIGEQVITAPEKATSPKKEATAATSNSTSVSGQATTTSDSGVTAINGEAPIATTQTKHYIDYIETSGPSITFSIEGNKIIFNTMVNGDPSLITVKDAQDKLIKLTEKQTDKGVIYTIDDKRFNFVSLRPATDEKKNFYLIIRTDQQDWPFLVNADGQYGVKYFNSSDKTVDLHKVPAIGFKNNQEFGSGRGYIWSRTLPMLKDTLLLGHGADTYCIYFPQEDYAGKYNSGTFSSNVNVIVDKPHNMYLGAAIGTGCLSVLALLALWGIYVVQSFRLYWREKFTSFNAYVGGGIFFGICGFLVSGLVNDSTVSVMPMFYGLLGTGIAINIMLKKQRKKGQGDQREEGKKLAAASGGKG